LGKRETCATVTDRGSSLGAHKNSRRGKRKPKEISKKTGPYGKRGVQQVREE